MPPPVAIESIVKNPLDEKRVEGQPAELTQEPLVLNDEQMKYLGFFENRLTRARDTRDRMWPEFTDKSYLQYYEENEKISNTYLEGKKNKDDVKISSGTIEAKLGTLLSHVDNLNLTPEILAFDENNQPLRDLGIAFTDILDRLAEHDGNVEGGDAEKRMLRQKELLKQGTVFIQDKWCTKRQAKKVLTKKYDGSFNFSDWETAWKTVYTGPDRVLLYGPNVYLGDITVFSMSEQPYVFTVETMTYDSAKTLYGTFENWKYVNAGNYKATTVTTDIGGRTIYDGKFRLSNLLDNQVEVIKYQDAIRDEFQIMINGIFQVPIGFPLSAVSPGGKINITKQILYPINAQFAYGKSFVSSGDVYELSKVIDEMLRLFVLKTRKSITPPYINTSGKVISRRVLSPGNIAMGIPPGALQAIGTESQGVTSGEFQVYQELIGNIERSTVSATFSGQQSKPGTTATEVLETGRQAKLTLGIIVSACTLMEQKLAYLRLPLIIGNYFEPIDQVVGEDGTMEKKYQTISRDTTIEGAGSGTRIVIPTDGPLPNQAVIRAMEIEDEKESGYPSQHIYLSVKNIRSQELTFRATVIPKEKQSSAYEKLQFRETINDTMMLMKMGSRPNVSGIEGEFAKVFNLDRNKYFASASDVQPPMDQSRMEDPGESEGPGNPSGIPAASAGMTTQVGAGQ